MAMRQKLVLGLDIGGSGVKGAIVDIAKGKFVSERIRIPTPATHTPENILSTIDEIVKALNWKGPIGCGFPGVVRSQTIETAANLGGKNFIGVNLADEIYQRCGCKAWVLNDADAAGLAEFSYGAGKNKNGVVMMFTIGTGIGSCLSVNGTLLPNLELGHLKMRDKSIGKNVSAEKICSDAIRKSRDLSWRQWAVRFNKYLDYVYALFRPNLIILGGGAASKSEKFLKYLSVNCDMEIATLQNQAGIIGSALAAYQNICKPRK